MDRPDLVPLTSAARRRSRPRSRPQRLAAHRAVGVLALGVLLTLTACAAGGNPEASAQADAGFWLGVWHGVITPVAFVVSLFRDDVGVYEVANSGAWYDFGYVLGLSVAFSGTAGSGAAAGRRRR